MNDLAGKMGSFKIESKSVHTVYAEHISGNVLTMFEFPWSTMHLTLVNTVLPLQRSNRKEI